MARTRTELGECHDRDPRDAGQARVPRRPATAIFALLGLIDVALTAVIGSPDAPPLIVSLGAAASGSSPGIPASARRGNLEALTAIVVTRVILAVLPSPRSS